MISKQHDTQPRRQQSVHSRTHTEDLLRTQDKTTAKETESFHFVDESGVRSKGGLDTRTNNIRAA